MALQLAIANIKRLIINEETQQLAVGDIDHRLPRFGIAIPRLRIGQGEQFINGVQVGAGDTIWLPLIEIPPQPDMAVGERENRLRLRQNVQVEGGLADLPLFDGKCRMFNHSRFFRHLSLFISFNSSQNENALLDVKPFFIPVRNIQNSVTPVKQKQT